MLDRSTAASSSSKPGEEHLQGTLHLTAHHLIFTGDGDELWVGDFEVFVLTSDTIPFDLSRESTAADTAWNISVADTYADF